MFQCVWGSECCSFASALICTGCNGPNYGHPLHNDSIKFMLISVRHIEANYRHTKHTHTHSVCDYTINGFERSFVAAMSYCVGHRNIVAYLAREMCGRIMWPQRKQILGIMHQNGIMRTLRFMMNKVF